MHQLEGIKTYLDGKFFLASLDDPQTLSYWMLGTHSTATTLGVLPFRCNGAIDIAQAFPDAQVTAVDIGPMFPRFVPGGLSGDIAYQPSQRVNAYHSPVPSNSQFQQQLDILTEPLAREPGFSMSS